MASAARQPLGGWRNEACSIPITVPGADLSANTIRAQIRLAPDTPGSPLLDLSKVGDAGSTGIHVNVSTVNGTPTTILTLQVAKTDMQGLPYMGELGEPSVLAYALQIDGATRLYGPFVALAHAIDSDNAPANRPVSISSGNYTDPVGGLTLNLASVGVTVSIIGVDLVAALITEAAAAADAAAAAAAQSMAAAAQIGTLQGAVADNTAKIVTLQRTTADQGDGITSLTGPGYRNAAPLIAGFHPGRDARRAQPMVRDKSGSSALTVRRNGVLGIVDFSIGRIGGARDARAGIPIAQDVNGAVTVSLDQRGGLRVADLVVMPTSRGRFGSRFLVPFTDREGRIAGGLTRKGEMELTPNHKTRENFYLAPGGVRGALRLAGAAQRLPGNTVGATSVELDGTPVMARQRRDTPLTTAIVDADGPVEFMLIMGQSNSGSGSGQYPPLITDPLYPRHVLTFAGGDQWYGTAAILPASLRDLVPACDNLGTPYGQSPSQALAFARECFNRDAARASSGMIVGTSWYGGQPIATFLPGTTSYANGLAMVAAAAKEAKRYGRSGAEVVCATYIQGETYAAYGSGSAADTRTGYAADLNTLIAAWLPAIVAASGQTRAPVALLAQTNLAQGSTTTSGIEMAQRDVMKARTDTKIAGPMYQYPLKDEGAGDIHLTNIGRLMFGEVLALAQQSVRDTGTWQPLDLGSVSRSGATLIATFTLPTGCAGLALSVDYDCVLPTVNLGFAAFKVSDGSALTISSIAVAGAMVTITLGADPGGAVRLSYGRAVDSQDQWAAARGQLYVESPTPSAYRRMGFAVPAYVRHYCLRCEEVTPS